MSESPEDHDTPEKAPRAKKEYTRPAVREYGDVRALTRSGSGTAQDKIAGTGQAFMTAK